MRRYKLEDKNSPAGGGSLVGFSLVTRSGSAGQTTTNIDIYLFNK